MSEVSPVLGLPYLQPAQAQKHVTHNEALRLLDVIVQLSVFRRDLPSPPPDPLLGDRYIVADAASGAWAGQETRIAILAEAGWAFVQPLEGWRAEVLDEAAQVVFDGGAWRGPDAAVVQFEGVGIGTGSDATNRLAVVSAASLLTHAGAGHQMKVNKAAASDTASLLFQTGFSGRAEMGTAGSDQFAIKVSADGAAWSEGLRVDPATGAVTAPNGLTVQGPLSLPAGGINLGAGNFSGSLPVARGGTGAGGPAGARSNLGLGSAATATVTATATDSTPGRLLKVGDFGIGTTADAPLLANWSATDLASGTYAFSTSTTNAASSPTGGAVTGVLEVRRVDATTALRRATIAGQTICHVQAMTGGSWGPWTVDYGRTNTVGSVSQAGGVPTGAVIERGANANGEYVRFVDGTQFCWRVIGGSDAGDTTWTFPAAFATAPVVTGAPIAGASVMRSFQLAAVPSATAALFNIMTPTPSRAGPVTLIRADGRWFNA